MEGTVKWFNPRKEFGFIKGEDGKDYFVHKSFVEPGAFLYPEDKVSFEPSEGDRGLQAKDVKLLQKASESESKEESKSKEKPKKEKKAKLEEDSEEIEEDNEE